MESHKTQELGVLYNHSMLGEERESYEARVSRLLKDENGYIEWIKQPIWHIYSTILELGFSESWKDFMSLEDFIWIFNKKSRTISAVFIDSSSKIQVRELEVLAEILKDVWVLNNDLESIIRACLEWTDYWDFPKKLAK